MSPDEFRKQGKQMIDWIADYYENIEKISGLISGKARETIKNQLPDSAPLESESMGADYGRC